MIEMTRAGYLFRNVCVLDAHVRDSCVQDVCVRNALFS